MPKKKASSKKVVKQAKKKTSSIKKVDDSKFFFVTMKFNDLSDVRLFQYQQKGPFMFSMGAVPDDGEEFLQRVGNGHFHCSALSSRSIRSRMAWRGAFPSNRIFAVRPSQLFK